MPSQTHHDEYVDLRSNGKIFPAWVLSNFKKYKLPPIIVKDNEDPCNVSVKQELNKYQEFMSKYLDPSGPQNEILVYHGLGSGKTAGIINMMNVMYNYDPNTNIVLLIKASLHKDPWYDEMGKWLAGDYGGDIEKVPIYKNIRWVHFNSPVADKKFFEAIKGMDMTKKTMFVIDEVHGFISNVYSNINSANGGRAQAIYDYILKEKRDNKNVKVVLASATPGVNVPFEFALLFNLLRPGIFPSSETEFNRLFVTDSAYPVLSPLRHNMFIRRILGLVTYYAGSSPLTFAKQENENINLPMTEYQYEIYREFELAEKKMEDRAKKMRKTSKMYKTYTRQASNFVFPNVSSKVTGILRPRPNKFRLTDKTADDLEKGKITNAVSSDETEALKMYFSALNGFLNDTEDYFKKIHARDTTNGNTIMDDLAEFKKGFETKYQKKFLVFYQSYDKLSELSKAMYECSPKMIAIAFMTHISPGKVMIYSNYVLMEGIDMMRVYLRLIGFDDCAKSKPDMGFCEYHGRISQDDRDKIKKMYNDKNNIRGNKCKVIMLSPSATEGIQLYNIRQEHIMEPYWTEVRISQVVGRGLRQCSHKDLPVNERIVNVYRYKTVKPDRLRNDDLVRESTDEHVESSAKAKDNLIQSFLTALKEAAVDCELFREHNMMSQTYSCFNFNQDTVLSKNIGPAYYEDIKEDIKMDSGLHSKTSKVERIRVIKVRAVYKIGNDFSNPDIYWYDQKTGMFYDYETHFPTGRAEIHNNIPIKLNKDTYVISDVVVIPKITRQI